MSIIQGTPVTVEALLDAVAKLSPAEYAQFERGLIPLRQRRLSIKEKVARLAKSYQFLPEQQERLSELLWKNKEGVIQPEEEKELDALIEELDRRKLRLADDIQKLACPSAGDASKDEQGETS
ncbi:hypothetical protein HYR99_06415 [Candidatus Poribacteria bacterium]|nr:hypothetical protein [Candidatus Poribacteria bacterium]